MEIYNLKGFGTNTTLLPEIQTISYPPAQMYYHGTQPGYSQLIQPTYSQVTQPTYSQTIPAMFPGPGLVMQGAGSQNQSLTGPSLNESLMGQSLNGNYMMNQI